MFKIILILIVLSITIFSKQEAIILKENYHMFIEDELVFDFYVINVVDLESLLGEATSSNGEKFKLEFKLDDEYKTNGSEVKVIGVFKNTPYPAEEPDKYKIEISYDKISTQSNLYVYNTIIEEEVNNLGIQFDNLATYGTDFFFQYTPPSGNNIEANQFAIYFKTDADSKDRGALPGHNANRSDRLTFPPSAFEASLEIVWINPITKKEVAIFPKKTVKIRPTTPTISTSFSSEYIAGDDVLSCRISNIELIAPSLGEYKLSKVDFSVEVDDYDVKVLTNYKIIGEPSFRIDDDNAAVDFKYNNATVDFKIMGEPARDGWAKGIVELKMTAIAINPINGVKSEPVRKTYSFKVNKKIEEVKVDIVKDTLNENDLLIMNKFPKNKKIEIYEIFNSEQIKDILLLDNHSGKEHTTFKDSEEILGQVSDEIKRFIEELAYRDKFISFDKILERLFENGFDDIPETDILINVYNYYSWKNIKAKELVMKVYAFTTHTSNNNKSPKELIGLIIVELPIEEVSSNINKNFYYIYSDNIKDTNELKNIKIDKNIYSYINLFELINSNLNNDTVILRKVIEKK